MLRRFPGERVSAIAPRMICLEASIQLPSNMFRQDVFVVHIPNAPTLTLLRLVEDEVSSACAGWLDAAVINAQHSRD